MAQATKRVGHAKKQAFLAAFAECGTITHAAQAAGVSRDSHYRWLREDPVYAAGFADAEDQAIEALEREVRRRGLEGVEEPVYQGGKHVGTIRRYSDTLLIFALKGLRPEKYRERISVVTEDAVDAEIRRLSEQLDRRRAEAGEARAPADAPG